MKKSRSFPLVLLMVLSLEKFIQHMFVTYAYLFDIGDLRSSVSLDYRAYMISGFIVGILFLVAFILLIQRNPWSLDLLLYLALFDLVGEFVAQGRLFITITVSFPVAALIIIVLWLKKKDLLEDHDLAASPDAQ